MKDWPWYGYLALAVIIFGVFFFLYIKPNNEEISSIKTERMNVDREIITLRAKKEEMDKIEKEIKSMTFTLRDLETIIPQKREIYDILRKIQQLANDSRLDIEKFTPKGEISKEFYLEWPLAIEITGNYHNLATFFDRLSNFSRLFNIEDFSIKAVQNQSETTTISAKSTAKTYIFHETTPEEEKENQKTTGNNK